MSVETGEAGEESIFLCPRAQLYNFDNGGWKEKGRGVFKLNVSDSEGARKARFIMRANQTFRVLVNQPVFKKMQVGDRQGREPSGKQFSFAVIEEGRPTPHLLKVRLLFLLYSILSYHDTRLIDCPTSSGTKPKRGSCITRS